MKIGLISDTHGFLDPKVFDYFRECDEVWHAGDFGTMEVSDKLESFKPLRGVYGNIDSRDIRLKHPEHQYFSVEGLHVWMTHIGGYPGKYARGIKSEIERLNPDIFISGHSHIVKVMRDKAIPQMLHMNPGAAGKIGFHKIRTLLRFDITKESGVHNLQAIELGKRG